METIAVRTMTARKPAAEATPTPFGLRVKQVRTERGMSMRGLAEAASVPTAPISHATVSLIESGRQSTVDVATAVRIARALGVTVEWLVTGDGRKP